MNATQLPRAARFGAGHVAAAVIAAWIVYVLVGGLEGTGQHFVVLGALRVVLFGALLAFAVAVAAHTRRLGRAGLILAAIGAAAYLFGESARWRRTAGRSTCSPAKPTWTPRGTPTCSG